MNRREALTTMATLPIIPFMELHNENEEIPYGIPIIKFSGISILNMEEIFKNIEYKQLNKGKFQENIAWLAKNYAVENPFEVVKFDNKGVNLIKNFFYGKVKIIRIFMEGYNQNYYTSMCILPESKSFKSESIFKNIPTITDESHYKNNFNKNSNGVKNELS